MLDLLLFPFQRDSLAVIGREPKEMIHRKDWVFSKEEINESDIEHGNKQANHMLTFWLSAGMACMNMLKIFHMGDTLLNLSPNVYRNWSQNSEFDLGMGLVFSTVPSRWASEPCWVSAAPTWPCTNQNISELLRTSPPENETC
eukprot:g32389.t1